MVMKKYLQVSILIGLIALKVSSAALHMYLHHGNNPDQEEKCELCEHAIQNQDIDSDISIAFNDLEFAYYNFSEQKDFYKSIVHKSTFYSTLFSRPPPASI